MSRIAHVAQPFLFLVFFSTPSDSTAAAAQSSIPSPQARQPVLSTREDSQALGAIREVLANPVTLEFVETPLGDVIDFVRDYTKVNVVVDRQALEQQGVTTDTPVTIHVQSIKLSSALNHLLRQHNLTWVLKEDCLVFTSIFAADESLVTRSYPIGDLAATPEDAAKLVALADRVLVAGSGSFVRMLLVDSLKAVVLTDNRSAHARAARLFEQLRGGAGDPDTVKKIKAKLIDPVTLEFVETPLSDVADFLKDYTGVNIVFDRPALEQVGITPDTTASIHVQSMELRLALTLILSAHQLTFKIEDECLVITSKVADQNRFDLRTYPVGKLLEGRAKLSGEEWLQLTRWALADVAAETGPSLARRVFAPGTRVLAQWAGAEFVATVMDLTENTYLVQFRVGNEERNEWLDASRVESYPRKAAGARPTIEFYEPLQALVVLGPDSLQNEVESIIGLVVKTADGSR